MIQFAVNTQCLGDSSVTSCRSISAEAKEDVDHIALYTGPPRGGGGATGTFCPGPHSAYGPQKDRYTLIEQSNNY